MLLALALFTLVAFVDAISNVTLCPKGCVCHLYVLSSDTQLYVDCSSRRLPEVDDKNLSQQLDVLLSSDHFVDHLTSLSISNSPLTRVPASVCKLVNLTSLNLNLNNITELPDNCFSNLTKLVTLSMKWNSIVGLQDGLFDGMQSLATLDLHYNHIAFIGLRVFSNSSDLTNLRFVDLSGNRLTSLEPWWYYRLILGKKTSPVAILLYGNLISNFTNKMKFEYRCGMKPTYGYLNLNHNKIIHIMDILNGWNFGRDNIYPSIYCLYRYHHDYTQSHTFTRISVATGIYGGSYDCDCTDFPIYRAVHFQPLSHTLDGLRCSNAKFYTTRGQPNVTSIPLIEFVCEIRDRCPSICQCVYRPANATLHVYCSATNMSSLPLGLPPLPKSYVRYKLDFFNNKLLRRLEGRPYFVNTSILDVSNCAISVVGINAWREIAKMQSPFVSPSVYLQNNKIKSLPSEVTNINITSIHLTLNNNPWECSCGNHWMTDWFKTLSVTSSNIFDVRCASPSRLKGRVITQSTNYDFCVDLLELVRILKISLLSTLTPVAVLLISAFAVYRLRVRLFRRWKFHPFDRDECVGEDMDYDVFLCCSSEDHNPHGLRILRELESKGYRVCYHERDFLPGQLIADNMVRGIERSKRTVCLLSTNFLRR